MRSGESACMNPYFGENLPSRDSDFRLISFYRSRCDKFTATLYFKSANFSLFQCQLAPSSENTTALNNV